MRVHIVLDVIGVLKILVQCIKHTKKLLRIARTVHRNRFRLAVRTERGPHTRKSEDEVRDGTNAVLPDGVPVATPNIRFQFVALQKHVRLPHVKPNLGRGLKKRRRVTRTFLLLEMLRTQQVHELFLLAEPRGPQHQPLAPDGVPIRPDAVIQPDTGLRPESAQSPFGGDPTGFGARVSEQALVPRFLGSFWDAVPVATGVAGERIGMARHVDDRPHLRVGIVEEVERLLDVLLSDVPVRSLGARHEVGF